MTQLSWQPPPVTKCGECPHFDGDDMCTATTPYQRMVVKYYKNKEGITESCPMWQQQNKDKKLHEKDFYPA